MIFQPAILLIIATLALPTHQTAKKYASKESIIDWTCKIDRCYCDEGDGTKVLKTKENEDIEKADDQTPVDEVGMCNNGFHMKYINNLIAVIQLQIIGANVQEEEPELMLYTSNDLEYFGCKYNRKTGEIKFKGDAKLKRKYDLSLFEDRSRIEGGVVLCAIKMGNAKLFKSVTINEEFDPQNRLTGLKGAPKMKLSKSLEFVFGQSEKKIFIDNFIRQNCDTYSFNDYSGTIQSRIYPVIHRDKDKLSCENYGLIYKMMYTTSENGPASEMKGIECGPEGATYDKKSLSIITEDANQNPPTLSTKAPDLYDYTIYCEAEFSKVCEDPIDRKECTNHCPIFSKGNATHPAKLMCPGNKWLIGGEYYELDAEPVCKQDTLTDLNKAVFSLSLTAGKAMNIKSARCFEEYDCRSKSKIHLPKCEGSEKCDSKVEYVNGILKCQYENSILSVLPTGQSTTLNTSKSYTCNKEDGFFYNSTIKIPMYSRVACIGKRESKTEANAFSAEAKYGIMAAIAFGILGAILGVTYLIIRKIKNKNLVQVKGKKSWKKLKKDEKIAACRKAFREKVILATSLTADNLFSGLDMVELLLEAETDIPECWAEVIPFLMRLQGAIVKIDDGVWHLFSRYMYLQAQKIIEKHGWLTQKPIRKKKPKGLIRSIAIHLLSFAIYDPLNPCAEELVQTGFQKLGFKAVEQYPHCGQMWALIFHARPIAFTKDENNTKFNYTKFMDYLAEVMKQQTKQISIPKEETIEPFGSIAEQAAYAIGAIPNNEYHFNNAYKYTTEAVNSEEGRVPAAYFRGMCESATRNPGQALILGFKMWPALNEKKMNELKAAIPKDSLEENVEYVMKIATYYGRHMDAKRIHSRFQPPVPETEVDSWQEQQEAFEEAVEKKKDALRKWFAKRTDIEELKKKPVYVTSGKVTLDNRITGDEVTDVKGGTKSGSNSNSEEKDPATPPPPPSPDALAAPSPTPPPAAAAAEATPPSPASAPAKK